MNKDYLNLFFVWFGFFIVLSVIFITSGIWVTFRTSLTIFALFVLPGFSLLYKQDFLERLVFGFIVSLALVGIPSYYLGLFGFHIQYHIALPIIITAIGIGLEYMGRPASGQHPITSG